MTVSKISQRLAASFKLSEHALVWHRSVSTSHTDWSIDEHRFGEGHSTESEEPSAPPPSHTLDGILRVDLLAQESITALAKGRCFAERDRPDYGAIYQGEAEQLEEIRKAAPELGVRPSLLTPPAKVAFWALGNAIALLPSMVSGAVAAGVQEAVQDTCNEQLRDLREKGVADAVPEVRAFIRKMRDTERAPEGAPKAPDFLRLSSFEVSPAEGMASIVRFGTRAMLTVAQKV